MRARFTLLALGSALVVSATLGALPYHVRVEVAGGSARAPEGVRQTFERELVERLRTAGCFASAVTDAAATADLVLRVTISEYEQRTREDVSGLTARDPELPPPAMDEILTETSAVLTLEVLTAEGRGLVRQRRWTEEAARPYFSSQDPRAAGTADWITSATRRSVKLACKGSPRAWAAEIGRASAGAGPR